MHFLTRPALFVSLLALALSPLRLVSAAETASLSGTVRNAATGKALEDAKVELPALGLSTLTDSTGRFVFDHLRRASGRQAWRSRASASLCFGYGSPAALGNHLPCA